jgi:hypothetical protein
MSRLVVVAFAVSLAAVGCYRPSFTDCQIACNPTGQCPPGLMCMGGYCTASAKCGTAIDADAAALAPGPDGGDDVKADVVADGSDAVAPDAAGPDTDKPDANGPDADASTPYLVPVKGVAKLTTAYMPFDHDTVAAEISRAEAAASGYQFLYPEGWIFTSQAPQTVPLQHYYSASRGDNLTVASAAGIQSAVDAFYTLVRTEGYVYATQQPGTVALNLYYSPDHFDNLTTANPTAQTFASHGGYVFLRTEGYVFAGSPYAVGWWFASSALSDNVSTAANGSLATQLGSTFSWTFRGVDAAYLVNGLPGTTSAITYFNPARGDYRTVVLALDKMAALDMGYVPVQTEGYLFDSQYNTDDLVPFTLYWNVNTQHSFTTYVGGPYALGAQYSTLSVQGYGLTPCDQSCPSP